MSDDRCARCGMVRGSEMHNPRGKAIGLVDRHRFAPPAPASETLTREEVQDIAYLLTAGGLARSDRNRLLAHDASQREEIERLTRERDEERERNPHRVFCPRCNANLPCASCNGYADIVDRAGATLERLTGIRAIRTNLPEMALAAEVRAEKLALAALKEVNS